MRNKIFGGLVLMISFTFLLAGCQEPHAIDSKKATNPSSNIKKTENIQQNKDYVNAVETSIFTESLKEKPINGAAGTGSYDVVIKFPKLTKGGNKDIQNKINQQIKKELIDYAESFRNLALDFENYLSASLDLDYSIILLNENILSIRYYGYETFGGAYGTHLTFVQNYDLISGSPIQLDDLFKKNSNYKSFLIEHAKSGVLEQMQKAASNKDTVKNTIIENIDSSDDNSAYEKEIASWVESAAKKNFKNFNLTSDALVLNFSDEDGMAHLWGGKWWAKIAYNELKEYLKPNTIINAGK